MRKRGSAHGCSTSAVTASNSTSPAAPTEFGSVTTVRFGCRAPGAGSFIELSPARLRRVVLNGRELDPATLTGNRLPLPGLRESNELRVEADMPYSRTGAGLHRFTDPADGETYLALHSGLDNAQRVFAAFDQPDLKAPVSAAVTAPGNWTVIGNGLARPAGDGRWELAATPPISTYLVTLVAGPYVSISTEHRGVPFGLHARRSLAAPLRRDAAELLAITRACFDRYREIFAEPYPYDSYDQAFVPELESGAVENPGCVTFRDDFLLAVRRDQGRAADQGHRDRARDGAHVVRRPGHHALVERRMAERVVRRVHGFPGAGRRHRLHRYLD